MTKGIRAARKEARPREILEAAFEEFSLRGYAATNVEHIAERAGVTKGTIYIYFSSKEAVFEQMVLELVQPQLDTSPYHQALRSTPAIDVLLDLLRNCYAAIVDDHHTREVLRFLIAESYAFEDLRRKTRDTFVTPLLSTVAAIIRHGCESKQFREAAADLNPLVLVGPVLGYSVHQHVFPEADAATALFKEQHLAMVRHLLERPTAG
jgi:AcrR family transcriptional regulator